MPSLRVVQTIPFPASTEHLSFHFGAEGRRALAIDQRSGRTWSVVADPATHHVIFHQLPVTIPQDHIGTLDWGRLSYSAAMDRVVIWTDRARVHGFPYGEVLAEIDHVPGRCVCMSPDGRWLISLEEDRGWTMDLASPSPAWSQTTVFQQREPKGWTPPEPSRDDEGNAEWDEAEEPERESVYLDHVDSAVAMPWRGDPALGSSDEGVFWLLAGCYGFVQSHLATPSITGWMLGRVVGESRELGGLVYDPTLLLQPAGPRHALVSHGSGAGLTAMDPATGESFHCRVRPPGHPYGFFRGVASCATAPMAWVRCADGDFLWRFGDAPEPMPAAPGRGVALYPHALLCATAEGLAWVEMPESSAVEPGGTTANPGSPRRASEQAATTDPASIEHDGCRLAYDVRGDGPPVLLIQGVGLHGDGWRPQVDALADRYRCLTFDNRGVGRSQPAGAEVSVERMAGDALALMDAQGWASAHVAGHSLGGLVALEMALRAPERVRSLALLCTFARGGDAARSLRMMWIGMRTRVGTRRMRRHAFLEIILPPGMLAGADRDALAAELAPLFGHDLGDSEPVTDRQLAAMRAYDAAPRLGELAGTPTLVVSAEHDPIAPPELGRALADGIPGARYVEIARASHGVPIHDAATVNRLLAEHLAAAEGAGPAAS